MKKFITTLMTACLLVGLVATSQALILFTYHVEVLDETTATYGIADIDTESSGPPNLMVISATAGGVEVGPLNAEGSGTDIDIADILVFDNGSALESGFDGSFDHGDYTFKIVVTDLASTLTGDFFVSGVVTGTQGNLQWDFNNTYAGGSFPQDLIIGGTRYQLTLPAQNFDPPAPDGTWTFHLNSPVPEPGTLGMLFGSGVAGSLFVLRRRMR